MSPVLRRQDRPDRPLVRRLRASDIGVCAAIDQNNPCGLPGWEPQDFRDFFEEPFATGLVAQREADVVGFALYRNNLRKSVVQLVRLVVSRPLRRQRVGAGLIRSVQQKCQQTAPGRPPVARITALVHESDLVAQLFFRAAQFRATAVCQGFFGFGERDGICFEYVVPARAPTATGK